MTKLKIFSLNFLISLISILIIISFFLVFSSEFTTLGIISTTLFFIGFIVLNKYKIKLIKKVLSTCKYCRSSLVGSPTSHREIKNYSTTKGDQYSVVLIDINCSNCKKINTLKKNFLTYKAERVDTKTGNRISGSTSYSLQNLIDEQLKIYQ